MHRSKNTAKILLAAIFANKSFQSIETDIFKKEKNYFET